MKNKNRIIFGKFRLIWVCLKMRLPGREVCLRGLLRGSVSWYVSGVCFGGLFRTVLLPRTVKFKGSVSGSVSKVCFGVCFGGLFCQSRTSQPYLKLHSPKKCKPNGLREASEETPSKYLPRNTWVDTPDKTLTQ